MSKIILPSKAYLVFCGDHADLEERLKKMGERMGCRLLKVQSVSELESILPKIKQLIAIVTFGDGLLGPAYKLPSHSTGFCFPIQSSHDLDKSLSSLFEKILSFVPQRLTQLINNAIQKIASQFLGTSLGELQHSFDVGLRFSNLITCDTSAVDFSAKAICEVDFKKIRELHGSLRLKNDDQLVDLFGEVCNQTLGVINFGLRPIGLDPLISLPIGVELSAQGNIAQVDFMPMIRMTDKERALAISVGIRIAPQCKARWDELVSSPGDGEVEFF